MSSEDGIKIVSVQSQSDAQAAELCRLCAKQIDGESSSIFSDNLHEALEEFLGISIGEADAWPKSVCCECVKRASETLEFVREIRASEDVFKRLFGANGPVVEFVVTEVAGGVHQDFDSDDVEVISDGEVFPDESMTMEDGEVIEDPDATHPEAYPEMDYGEAEVSAQQEEVLPVALAPRRRYKTDDDFRRAEAFYSISCTICLIKFNRLKELRAHYRELHQQEGYVLCCGKKLFRLTYMLDHMEFHENQEAFKCDQCGKCTDSQTHLRSHQQQAHPGIYSHRKKVIERMWKANKQRCFICPHCGRQFDYKSSMEKHVVQLHQGGTQEVCGICGKFYKSRISFARHMKNHEAEAPKESEELLIG